MKYREDKYGNKVSALGYGCMRFSNKGFKPDYEKTSKELMCAYNKGVNYFDTAYLYLGSEELLGRFLSENNLRDKVYIATKLPHYMVKKYEDIEKFFQEELTRLRTDHVDYYLMHMLTDIASWNRLVDLGIKDWIKEKKESGAIRQIGFSYHGNSDMFCKIIDSYDWDICLIQYNYLDENSQAGKTGLKHAHEKGIPVNIMEPLRGGRLVNSLPKKAYKLFNDYKVKKSPAEWSFSWLWDQEGIMTVLSGMNSIEMVEQNTDYADRAEIGSFTEEDRKLLEEVVKAINEKMKVPCTGCRYCMPCPKGVDIPGIFSAYNKCYTNNLFTGMKEYLMCTTMRKDATGPSNCVKCGKCEMHCPQGIKVREELQKARKKLENPLFKIARWYVKHFMKY